MGRTNSLLVRFKKRKKPEAVHEKCPRGSGKGNFINANLFIKGRINRRVDQSRQRITLQVRVLHI